VTGQTRELASPVVIKFGGELLDDAARLRTVVGALSRIGAEHVPMVIVHGGGKEIDAALAQAGIDKRQVDGLRITDDRTLAVVVAVLAGTVNTRFVAALNTAGVAAVGLTGADGSCGLSDKAPGHHATDGRVVDLGRVGIPSPRADMHVVTALVESRLVPVIACIGIGADGELLNVNADTFAGHVAGRLKAGRLVIAGTTRGVLDDTGTTVSVLGRDDTERLIGSRTATAGMIAKLRACVEAIEAGVGDVMIVDGRNQSALVAAALGEHPAEATRLRTYGGASAARDERARTR
jgi:acetylglutamate kinase